MTTETVHWRHPSGSAAAPRAALWLVLVMLAGLAGLASLMVWQSYYKAAVATGEARALSSAHVVAAHLEWMIEASDQALRRVDVALGDLPVSNSTGAIADISQAVGDLRQVSSTPSMTRQAA